MAFMTNEAAFKAWLVQIGDLEGVQIPLAALALALAQQMDRRVTGLIAQQYRETLICLKEAHVDNDVVAEMLAAMGDAEDSVQVVKG